MKTVDAIESINYLPRTKEPGAHIALRVRQLEVTHSDESVVQHRFGLVNFSLNGKTYIEIRRPDGAWHTHGMPVQLRVGKGRVDALIVPVANDEDLYRLVMTVKTQRILSELVVPAGVDPDAPDFAQALNDLCLVLSVARGTPVQWVYREDWSDAKLVHTSHRSRLTKQCCP